MNKIVYVPLDERPCNYDYPLYLAGMTDLQMAVPSRSMLGDKKQPANTEAVAQWLVKEADDADYALVSIDMLLYGGIVPSRLHQLDLAELERRMSVLRVIKSANPSLKLYAFHLITRAPAYSSSEEEPDYYADYGRELYEYGWLMDKRKRDGLDQAEEERLTHIENTVPSTIFDDFLGRRTVNKQLNQHSVSLVDEGVIDYLVIPLDDNSLYGYTSSEQRSLVHLIQHSNLLDRIAVYPGADEIGCTMFSRIFCEIHQYEPLIHIRYSSTLGPAIVPKYEDRSLNESIKHHITASGAYVADGFEAPDIFLMVHSPAASGVSVAETTDRYDARHHSYFSEVNIREFASAIERYARLGKVMVLGDVALCNGGDDILMKLLAKKGLLDKLDGYAAWNTSGNALGTVISHAIITAYNRAQAQLDPQKEAASRMYYYYRLIEDWGYQSVVRQYITDELLPGLKASYFQIEHVQDKVEEMIEQQLQHFANDYIPYDGALTISKVTTPWKRMFEIGFLLESEQS
ncbi:DUF4127 family protein [Paenibacillus sp. 1011MAR3C5]|uniref:DUF4127 family protein n=1 Tax=Paenibacillus sp. 1011MAR3C5 TaxID=1675787 RepID=UPI000E6C6C18|nr:DUF4127 family protein [Paenibacillus sp. 1011MAR3C5]RJE82837.1 DUF4127 family protein [Paenibacillus sp. 1011MAR3C5]